MKNKLKEFCEKQGSFFVALKGGADCDKETETVL